jgi:type VI secretion system protein ImpJ
MSWRSAVVWSQGMFLQPHHFQQEARYVARLVDARARCLSPHAWGVTELVLDDAMLALGRVGIARASGVLPDGTPFSMPQFDAPPAPLEIPSNMKDELVYLALPFSREGVCEVDFGDNTGALAANSTATSDTSRPDTCRFDAVEESIRDHTSASDEAASIQTGRLKLCLMRAKDCTDAYAKLGVVRVAERRGDNQVVLDRSYIAPEVALNATDALVSHAQLLHGLISQRGRALAGRMGKLSSGVAELADFMMLQVLNRAEPLFYQHANAPSAHPFALYTDCLQLAGELATFASTDRHPERFPLYNHEDLNACFLPLMNALRKMLSIVLSQNAVQIELIDRKHGVRTAVVADLELVRTGALVLAVQAAVPADQLRQRFPSQTKIGPVDRIKELVNLQLPGIALRDMPVAPRQLPYHAGYFYFEMDRRSELWLEFEKSGNLAMHISGEFPGLELELWAIR